MDDLSGLLHHVELYVSDRRASTEFWGWFLGELGYVEFQRWEEGISGRLGPTYLVLVQVESRHLWPPYHRSRVGLNHLAFHANSRAQVDEITGALRRRGWGSSMKIAIHMPEAGDLCRVFRRSRQDQGGAGGALTERAVTARMRERCPKRLAM